MTATTDGDPHEPGTHREGSPGDPRSDPVGEPDRADLAQGADGDRTGSLRDTAARIAWWATLVAVFGVLVAAPVLSQATPGGVYVVASDSMEPTIPVGSLVVATPGQPQVGDVVVYEAVNGAPHVHRVVDVDRSGESPTYTTRGDNNAASDSYVVESEQIRGVVQFHLPYMGGFWLLPLWIRGATLGLGVGLYLLGEMSEDGRTASQDRRRGGPPDERRDPDGPVRGR